MTSKRSRFRDGLTGSGAVVAAGADTKVSKAALRKAGQSQAEAMRARRLDFEEDAPGSLLFIGSGKAAAQGGVSAPAKPSLPKTNMAAIMAKKTRASSRKKEEVEAKAAFREVKAAYFSKRAAVKGHK